MAILSEATEDECIKERYLHLTTKIRIVQYCASMSAIAEFLLRLLL